MLHFLDTVAGYVIAAVLLGACWWLVRVVGRQLPKEGPLDRIIRAFRKMAPSDEAADYDDDHTYYRSNRH